MNVFFRELKDNLKSLIIWCIGVLFMVGAGMSKYAGLSGSDEALNDIMTKLPNTFQAVLGTGTLNLSKASGFYGVLFLYILLMAAIHAVILGANIISKEERDKTSEFLMVKPVSRDKIIGQKLLAALLNIIILNIISLSSSIAIVNQFGKGENFNKDILLLTIGMFLVQVLFLSIGSALAAYYKDTKKSVSLSTSILLIAFFMSIMIDLSENFQWLKYLTPFKYFEAKNVMYGGGLDTSFIIISIVLSVILTISTFVFYKRRDLNI